jgi:D-alanyl-D-alanine carboxypeptidase
MTARSLGRIAGRVAAAALCLVLVAAAKPAAPTKPGQAAQSQTMEAKADVALLVDYATGAVLYEKNPDRKSVV